MTEIDTSREAVWPERYSLDEDFGIQTHPTGKLYLREDVDPIITALIAEVAEWKAAATRHHPNPADFRYWEGRYRDEKARAEAAEAAARTARDDAIEEAARMAHEAWLDGVPVAEIAAAIRALMKGDPQ